MAIQLTFSNMFQLFSAFSPLLLGFFLIMSSIFNQNIRGLVYLGGILIACAINMLIMNVIGSPSDPTRSPLCDLVQLPFGMNQYNSPALSSLFISFTLAYLVLPMITKGTYNYSILVCLLGLLVIDTISKVGNRCTSMVGSLLGTLTGLVLGGLWFALLHSSGNKSLLFFDEVDSSSVQCSRPSRQTFKCAVYKNGELIKNL